MPSVTQLPPIPDKRYFTIGEVARLCTVKPHVLRYWEQEFQVLNPSKRRGNRRYYQHQDVLMVRKIKSLLYEQGFTIGGARQQLMSKSRQSQKISSAASKHHAELAPFLRELQQDIEALLLELA